MARTVHVHLLDDIDGSTADETVKFSLDGTFYEIDLNATHSEQLRKTVARYIVAGRRSAYGVVTGARSRHHTGTTQNQAIREWARRAGHDINTRGRIPASLIEQFEKETNR
jgi:nucleoid-associated protein Lsr2